MLSPIPRRGGWDRRFCSCSPNHVSLPRKEGRVGPRIVLFEACSAFTRVTACTLATSPYIVTRWSPEASTVSLPPQLLRLLPAGAFRRVGLSPTGKRRLFTAHLLNGHSGSTKRTVARTRPATNLGQRHSKSDSPIGLHCGGNPCLRQYSGRCQCCIACFRPLDLSHAASSRDVRDGECRGACDRTRARRAAEAAHHRRRKFAGRLDSR